MNCNYKVKITDIQTKYKFKVFCTGYDDSEIKEKIDAMYQAWPKASGEGETPTLDNTANATMSIDLKGNTSQDGTPTPDDPVDVQVVTGDNTIKVEGKNLFKDKYILAPSNENKNAILKAGTYTIATCDNNTFGTNIYFKLFDSNGNIITTGGHLTSTGTQINFSTTSYSYYGGSGAGKVTFTIDNDYQLNIGLLNSTGTRQVMLVKGTTEDRNYIPYQSQSYAVNLGTMELCKIGDYQDYIYKDNKKWYKYGTIGKAVLNGSENWNNDGGTQGTDYRHNIYYSSRMTIPIAKGTNGTYLSNYFTPINIGSDVGELGTFYMSNTWLVFPDKNKAYDLDAWKSWLGTNQPKIYYVLATPTTTEITDTTLISQLEALTGAESYSGQTNISQTNDDKPFIITAKALKDLSNL